MPQPKRVTSGPSDPGAAFERGAGLLFLVLLVIVGFVGLTILGAATDVPPGARLVAFIGLPLAALPLLVADWGLARKTAWGRTLAFYMVQLILLGGIVRFFASLQTGVTIPLEAIAALLLIPRAPVGTSRLPTDRRDRRIVFAGIALYLGAIAWPVAGAYLTRPGQSFLAVDERALDLRLTADCSDALGDAGIRVTVTWTWRARDFLPGSVDGLFVEWPALAGGTSPYLDQEASDWSPGVWPGSGSPSAALLQQLELGRMLGSFATFGIDGAVGNQADGRIDLVLRAADDVVPAELALSATYVHLDRWMTQSPTAVCRW